MADQYVEVTQQSWGSNIFNSFGGLLLGLLLFFGLFFVLWNNEGAVDLSKVAGNSIVASADTLDKTNEGKFVSVSGPLVVDNQIGDPQFLKPGDYVSLNRQVEMCAWHESKQSKTDDKLGGGSETKTTYSYHHVWTGNPQDSSRFKITAGHANPRMSYHNTAFTTALAKIGAFSVNLRELALPKAEKIEIDQAKLIRGSLEGEYVFLGSGTLDDPKLGDLRIAYTAVPNSIEVTVFGKQTNRKLVPYRAKGKEKIYRALAGSRDEAVAEMAGEHKTKIWLVRILGFAMMWGGMVLFFGPLNAILKVVPVLGTAGRWLATAVTFPLALGLSAMAIIISKVAHNVWLLLGLVAILVIIVMLVSRAKKGQ